jgi:HEAT repeat protein
MLPRFLFRWLLCALLLGLAGCLRPDPVRAALRQLQNPAATVRREAVEKLGALHDARATDPLIACLQDPDPAVRGAAVGVLGGWHEPRAVDPIIGRLHDPVAGVRRAAAEALGGLHDARAVEPLRQCLTASEAELRRAAAAALGQLGDARAVEPLLVCLTDKDPGTVSATLVALGALHDARAVAAIIPCLANSDEGVRGKAVDILCQLGAPAVEPLLASLKAPKPQVRALAAEALGRLGDARAVDPLVACLKEPGAPETESLATGENAPAENKKNEDTDEPAPTAAPDDGTAEVRQKAAEALGRLGRPAVEPLLACLDENDATVKGLAAETLGKIQDARAIGPLVDHLAKLSGEEIGENVNGRDAVIAALTKFGPPAIAPLVAHLQDKDLAVRKNVAETLDGLKYVPADDAGKADFFILRESWDQLVKLGAPAVAPLIAALKLDDTATQEGAAEALGRLGDRRAVEPLIARLQGGSGQVAQKAAAALGLLGDPQAVDPLIAVLKADEPEARRAAAEALGRLGDDRAVGALAALLKDPDADLRQTCAQALGKLKYAPETPGDRATYLIALRSWDEVVKLGGPAYEPLAGCLADDNSDVRRDVIASLGKLGDKRAIAPLSSALPDWDFNAQLVSALEKLGWKPTTEAEEVYSWIGRKDSNRLKERWDQTRRILLADVSAEDRRRIENAVYSFVAIGESKILEDLVRILDDQGNTEIAETYLNSGNDQLHNAARAWADRNGYTIIPGPGAHRASWGGF